MRATMLGALLILTAMAVLAPQGAASADPCANPTHKPPRNSETGVLIQGSTGPDVIVGTKFNDALEGGGGNDIICGLGGNDRLNGDQDDDTLYGGDGRDTLSGGYDDDDLFGGAGNDTFFGGTNDHLEEDFCNGGAGDRDRNPVDNPDDDCDISRSIER